MLSDEYYRCQQGRIQDFHQGWGGGVVTKDGLLREWECFFFLSKSGALTQSMARRLHVGSMRWRGIVVDIIFQ